MSLCEDDRRPIETLAYVEDDNRFLWDALLWPCPRWLSSQKGNTELHETVQAIVQTIAAAPPLGTLGVYASNICLLVHAC